MRDATRIKELADEALKGFEAPGIPFFERDHVILRNLREISAIAERMDARTGTIDPSEKD